MPKLGPRQPTHTHNQDTLINKLPDGILAVQKPPPFGERISALVQIDEDPPRKPHKLTARHREKWSWAIGRAATLISLILPMAVRRNECMSLLLDAQHPSGLTGYAYAGLQQPGAQRLPYSTAR